jgi:hypothetical protein
MVLSDCAWNFVFEQTYVYPPLCYIAMNRTAPAVWVDNVVSDNIVAEQTIDENDFVAMIDQLVTALPLNKLHACLVPALERSVESLIEHDERYVFEIFSTIAFFLKRVCVGFFFYNKK